jgi:hypothetical protein
MRTVILGQMSFESDKILMSSRRSIEEKEEIVLSEQLDVFGMMVVLFKL